MRKKSKINCVSENKYCLKVQKKCLSYIPATRLIDYSLFWIRGKGKYGKWNKKPSRSKTMKSFICYTAVIVSCKNISVCSLICRNVARRQNKFPSWTFVSSMCVGVSVKRQVVWCFILDLVLAQTRKVPCDFNLIY